MFAGVTLSVARGRHSRWTELVSSVAQFGQISPLYSDNLFGLRRRLHRQQCCSDARFRTVVSMVETLCKKERDFASVCGVAGPERKHKVFLKARGQQRSLEVPVDNSKMGNIPKSRAV